MPDGGRPPQSDIRNVLVAIQQAFTVIGMAASGFFSPKAAGPLTTNNDLASPLANRRVSVALI